MRKLLMLQIIALLLHQGGCAISGYAPQAGSGEQAASTPGGRASGESITLVAAPSVTPGSTHNLVTTGPRKVIYTARLGIVVKDAKNALAATGKLAKKMGGYMQHMTNQTIVIRVPASRFDETLVALDAMGAVMERDITAEDVTEEYLDLKIRLKNAKVLEEKLRALLDKAKTVKEALEVERELARVRAEGERLQGRLNRLANRVAYATVSVAFTEVTDAGEEFRLHLPFWWLKTLGVANLLRF